MCTSVKYSSFMNFNDRCGNKKKKNYRNETIFSHMILSCFFCLGITGTESIHVYIIRKIVTMFFIHEEMVEQFSVIFFFTSSTEPHVYVVYCVLTTKGT